MLDSCPLNGRMLTGFPAQPRPSRVARTPRARPLPPNQGTINPSEHEQVLSREGEGVGAQWERQEPEMGNTQGSFFSPVTSGLGSETQAAR